LRTLRQHFLIQNVPVGLRRLPGSFSTGIEEVPGRYLPPSIGTVPADDAPPSRCVYGLIF
jgi:hypothetical protein